MKVTLVNTISVQIQLSENEATWLKAVKQNPLHGESIENETETDNNMRATFWDKLNEVGI